MLQDLGILLQISTQLPISTLSLFMGYPLPVQYISTCFQSDLYFDCLLNMFRSSLPMIFLCVLIFKLSLQGELCPWLPTCRWGRHILSGVAHCVVESLGHCFVFLQEKAVALPPRTGGGLISSGTIRFASTTLDGTRDYWLLESLSEKVLKWILNP